MPAPGHALTRRVRGFTLFEILVVLFIIGLMTSLAVLSVAGSSLDDRLREEARRLEQLFKLAQEEAELRGYEMGFRHTTDGYEFLVMGADGNWLRYDQGPLRSRAVPAPLQINLRVEGKLVAPTLPAPAGASLSAQQALQSAQVQEQAGTAGAASDTREALDEREATEDRSDKEKDNKLKAVQPQVLLLSSGETTPFVLDIGAASHKGAWRLEGDTMGGLKLARADEGLR